jgi:hypothetical protein
MIADEMNHEALRALLLLSPAMARQSPFLLGGA